MYHVYSTYKGDTILKTENFKEAKARAYEEASKTGERVNIEKTTLVWTSHSVDHELVADPIINPETYGDAAADAADYS